MKEDTQEWYEELRDKLKAHNPDDYQLFREFKETIKEAERWDYYKEELDQELYDHMRNMDDCWGIPEHDVACFVRDYFDVDDYVDDYIMDKYDNLVEVDGYYHENMALRQTLADFEKRYEEETSKNPELQALVDMIDSIRNQIDRVEERLNSLKEAS